MSTGSESQPGDGRERGEQPPEDLTPPVTQPAAPAGWYPVGDGTQRYWDGEIWTEHVAPGPGAAGYRPLAGNRPAYPVTSDERTMSVLCHVLSLVTGFLGPLIIWIVKKDESAFIDAHGKAALNFQLSFLIYWFAVFISVFLLIGLLLIPILGLLQLIFPIVAAVAANKGELYKYPLAITFLS